MVPSSISHCSDFEGHGQPGDKGKKKEKPKTKRKKVHERQIPRLTIINIEQDNEVVECQLETAKHSTVTFKFNRDDDQPSEIAANLVSSVLVVIIIIVIIMIIVII